MHDKQKVGLLACRGAAGLVTHPQNASMTSAVHLLLEVRCYVARYFGSSITIGAMFGCFKCTSLQASKLCTLPGIPKPP